MFIHYALSTNSIFDELSTRTARQNTNPCGLRAASTEHQPQGGTPTQISIPTPNLKTQVADDGIPMVMKAMNFCPEEETVQLYGCRALYNFVYRCEHAHLVAIEEGGALGIFES